MAGQGSTAQVRSNDAIGDCLGGVGMLQMRPHDMRPRLTLLRNLMLQNMGREREVPPLAVRTLRSVGASLRITGRRRENPGLTTAGKTLD